MLCGPRRPEAITVLIAAPTAALAVSLASHRFADVRNGSTHAAGIEWLASTGVTSGCAPDGFCPGGEVTRGQMATFLYRLAGNDPAVGPVVDAATVQGVAITDLGLAPLADASCPANQVVAGFQGGTIVCQPVTSITSADGSHTVTVTNTGVTITGIERRSFRARPGPQVKLVYAVAEDGPDLGRERDGIGCSPDQWTYAPIPGRNDSYTIDLVEFFEALHFRQACYQPFPPDGRLPNPPSPQHDARHIDRISADRPIEIDANGDIYWAMDARTARTSPGRRT